MRIPDVSGVIQHFPYSNKTYCSKTKKLSPTFDPVELSLGSSVNAILPYCRAIHYIKISREFARFGILTLETSMTLSTSTLVFDTPELLELILSHLDLLEILRLQCVNHRFLYSITNSPVLKRKTFKTQPTSLSGKFPSFFDDTFCGFPRHTALREQLGLPSPDGLEPLPGSSLNTTATDEVSLNEQIGSASNSSIELYGVEHDPLSSVVDDMMQRRPAETNAVPHVDGRLFNPILGRLFSGLRVQHLEYGWTLITVTELPEPAQMKHVRPSWKGLLLTALPLKELRIEPAVLLQYHKRDATGGGGVYGPISPPNADEERRIAALHTRMSTNLASSSSAVNTHRLQWRHRAMEIDRRRYGDAGIFAPVSLPVSAAIRWAAAKGEASNEGWVWGSSLQFAGGKKPFPGYATRLSRKEGVTVGQLEEEMRGSKWLNWVIRRVPEAD